ncbi:MAG: gephyrin-like molybdotransferase Glp [Pseudomonadota bacterium]|nr:gephyrin-like molybdotransferase Glp [Pseudomonadota bacterium]
MIPVAEARRKILDGLPRVPSEVVSLERAAGRVLAADVIARRTQPPADLSAMDGYAVRSVDCTSPGAVLQQVGESAAGHGFAGTVGPMQTARIFTGAPLPAGADAVLIQEDASVDGTRVTATIAVAAGAHIRRAGIDFTEGDAVLRAGRVLAPRDIGLAAACNVPWLTVSRRPRIALLSTGDELVRPGEPIGPDQIVSSNALSIAALVRQAGGEPVDLGIALDRPDSLRDAAAQAAGCDLLVTLGGASVGEHDLVRGTLAEQGLALDFWKIAMRPGKPLMFGRTGDQPLLGLPGNPVSALVCGLLFLAPAIRHMAGAGATAPRLAEARLGADMRANDTREDYVRAGLDFDADGGAIVTPFARQDSSMLSALSRAGALIVRAPHAPAIPAGTVVRYIPLDLGL